MTKIFLGKWHLLWNLVSGGESCSCHSHPETKSQSRCRLPRKFLVNFLFDFFMFHEILDNFQKIQFPVFLRNLFLVPQKIAIYEANIL